MATNTIEEHKKLTEEELPTISNNPQNNSIATNTTTEVVNQIHLMNPLSVNDSEAIDNNEYMEKFYQEENNLLDEGEYEDDDDEEEEEEEEPRLETILKPAVSLIVCHRCRRSMNVVLKTNQGFIPLDNKNRRMSNSNTMTSATKKDNGISAPELIKSLNNSFKHNPKGGFLRRKSVLEMNNASPVNTSEVLTIERARSLSNTPTPNSPLQPTLNQRKFTLTKEYPYQFVNEEEYYLYSDYLNKLFGYLNDKANIDNELCLECLETLIVEKEREYQTIESETKVYEKFIKQKLTENNKRNNDVNNEEEILLEELNKLEKEEAEWGEKILALQNEEALLDFKESKLKEEELELNALEQKYWLEYNQFQLELNAFQQERDALQQQLLFVSKMLDKLNASNALNDIFYIWYEGHFATINNFRLGRLSTQFVEWNEINAAWGQAALLLSCLAKRVNYAFNATRIIPIGSFSKIDVRRTGGWNTFELFGGQGGLFWQGKYDKAQIAFLGCIKELADYCANDQQGTIGENRNSDDEDYKKKIPYPINGDTIGGISLRWGDEERWTRACKYLLTDLKWLIGVVSYREHSH
jgi:hypothetical protein